MRSFRETHPRHTFAFGLVCLLLACSSLAVGQIQPVAPAQHITKPLNESERVTLKGNTHPLAVAKYDHGLAPGSLPMEHMYLTLQRSPEQEAALTSLLSSMQDPSSPHFHHWLTAEQLRSYGPAQQDIDTVVRWLEDHGLQVNGVSKSGLSIDVSGTAARVGAAFGTEIHTYVVNGKQHIANASDPQIPAALSPLIAGFNSLNSFKPKPAVTKPKGTFTYYCNDQCPDGFADSYQFNEAPADLATIYNANPLYTGKHPITGKGQTVVVLEDSDINPADYTTFRHAFHLDTYSGTFQQIHPGTGCNNPGKNGAEGEAALDAEWAGAVAPDADVELASCASSETNPGYLIAAQNLLDRNNPPPIMSLSYLYCEAELGPSGNLYVAQLWEQAALEGVSVFVASGDGGAAGCDNFNTSPYAVAGIQANGLASTPFNTATGGTDFLDTVEGANSEYWRATNTAAGESAKSYIPETTWNDSCASSLLAGYYGFPDTLSLCNSGYFLDILAGSGAPSFVYAKPYWQKATFGVPTDKVRDLPDVSLFASNGFWNHAILFCMSDPNEGGAPCNYTNPADTFYNSAGGTSFTAPQFASIQALINQKAEGPQGNAAPIYYSLAKLQYGTNASPNSSGISACNSTLGPSDSPNCYFHDVTVGDNDVPCYGTNDCYGGIGLSYGVLSTSDKKFKPAYPATPGWDFATGLGSINITNIVNAWP